VTDIAAVPGCGRIIVATTLTDDADGSNAAFSLCEKAVAAAHAHGVDSVFITAKDTSEIAVALSSTTCIRMKA